MKMSAILSQPQCVNILWQRAATFGIPGIIEYDIDNLSIYD